MKLKTAISVLAAIALFVTPALAEEAEKAKEKAEEAQTPEAEQAPDQSQQRVQGIFARFDTDQDGFLSKEEHGELLKVFQERMQQQQQQAGDRQRGERRAGARGAGRERMRMLQGRFEQIDTNNDEKISLEEYAESAKDLAERIEQFQRGQGRRAGN